MAFWYAWCENAPGRSERSPAHSPLRTVRESFPSYGSSLSKAALDPGDPAIRAWLIIICKYSESRLGPYGRQRRAISHRVTAPSKTPALLKILDPVRVIRI